MNKIGWEVRAHILKLNRSKSPLITIDWDNESLLVGLFIIYQC